MKLFIDDCRLAPDESWVTAANFDDAQAIIRAFWYTDLTEISFDHDLGDKYERNGYDLMLWIEGRVYSDATTRLTPFIIHVHTANSGARTKMLQCAESIMKAPTSGML